MRVPRNNAMYAQQQFRLIPVRIVWNQVSKPPDPATHDSTGLTDDVNAAYFLNQPHTVDLRVPDDPGAKYFPLRFVPLSLCFRVCTSLRLLCGPHPLPPSFPRTHRGIWVSQTDDGHSINSSSNLRASLPPGVLGPSDIRERYQSKSTEQSRPEVVEGAGYSFIGPCPFTSGTHTLPPPSISRHIRTTGCVDNFRDKPEGRVCSRAVPHVY